MASTVDADEEYARRLQAQELGGYHQVPNVEQVPLVGNRGNENVVNARVNEVATSWATIALICIVNIPQVLAAMIILPMKWDTDHVCDTSHTGRWKWWAFFSAFRLLAYSVVIFLIQLFRNWLRDRPNYNNRALSVRNTIDAFGLIWFVVGNMWLFGDDLSTCKHPSHSPVYNLCLAMIIINYVQICLPCIIAILLIPVFCFCMPCLIRILARLDPSRTVVGATQATIDTIPLITVTANQFSNGQENTCPICLTEFAEGDQARLLICQHMFHQQCVDEWLRVNATCPTCRKRVDGSTPATAEIQMNPVNRTQPQGFER